MLVVFTGPSLDPVVARAALPGARVEPPACRGDVDRALAQGASIILLIDGGFAHRLAVAPSEIVRALRAGAHVVGAASLGAIRAAECHPAGMLGIGAVQRLYRLRVLANDDEVAVATEPERGFRASSVALVNVRFAVLTALRARLLDRGRAEMMLAAAKRMHFSERRWDPILDACGVGESDALRALCQATDIKRRDAERAVKQLAGSAHTARAVTLRAGGPPGGRQRADGYLGHWPTAAPDELCRWLAASGRYRRYWPDPPPDPDRAWSELGDRRERDLELMRWHAVRRGVELAGEAEGDVGAARARVARSHGYTDWKALCATATVGVLPCGVPLVDAADAAWQLALAARGLRVGS
jgi:hypothetical protein